MPFYKTTVACLTLPLVACLTAVKVDSNETTLNTGPAVIYNPAKLQLPTPTNLVIDTTTGKLNIPPLGPESAAQTNIRTTGLNHLDGYSTVEPLITIDFTDAIDQESLSGRLFLFRLETDGVASDPTKETPVALLPVAFPTPTELIANPAVPLAGHSQYVAALLSGVTAGGVAVQTTATFALLRQPTPPVIIDNGIITTNNTPFDPSNSADLLQIEAFSGLYNASQPAFQFLDVALPRVLGGTVDRTRLLVAFPFATQTITAPLDARADGPAQEVFANSTGLTVVTAHTSDLAAFIKTATGRTCGDGTSGTLDCTKIQEVDEDTMDAANYQPTVGNLPGQWSDPDQPVVVNTATLQVLVMVPKGANGHVVIYGHGLGASKEDMLNVAPALAQQGIGAVSIDWVLSGTRAVQVSTDASLGCSGPVTYLGAGQCFAPIISTDLTATRDNLRQSMLDAMLLGSKLKACGTTGCGALHVDADHIGYIGQSLGGLLGVPISAMSPQIHTTVINVGGTGLVNVATQTPDPGIKCPLVDGLIAAGVLTGTPWLPTQNPAALCLTPDWFRQPNAVAFLAVAQWLLDPADGLNFISEIANPSKPSFALNTLKNGVLLRVLLQEVIDDQVVPNVVSETFGQALNLPKSTAASDLVLAASSATTDVGNLWLQYQTNPNDTYGHPSLTVPAVNTAAGALGTQQMQLDAATYLGNNL